MFYINKQSITVWINDRVKSLSKFQDVAIGTSSWLWSAPSYQSQNRGRLLPHQDKNVWCLKQSTTSCHCPMLLKNSKIISTVDFLVTHFLFESFDYIVIHSFSSSHIHSFFFYPRNNSLSNYYVADTYSSSGNTEMNKRGKNFCLRRVYILMRRHKK